jgi:hypothetical protein
MWAIRILSGEDAGQIHALKAGSTKLGRGPECAIRLKSHGISKEHAQILVTEDKVIISDKNSRNGTFVNGIRIQNQKLLAGDKVSFHDVLCDVLVVPETAILPLTPAQQFMPSAAYNGNLAVQPQENEWPAPGPAMNLAPTPQLQPMGLSQFRAQAENYLDTVVLPGVFQFAEKVEFRWVLGFFVTIYIGLVTVLATIPMSNLIKSSIQEESGRRALTIARNLASSNRQAILDNLEISVSTRQAEVEEGVSTALIISSKDGHIIAPANQRGSFADKPFINRARKEEKEKLEQLDNSMVGASVPITYYNPELGTQSVAAHAVILYDMGSVAMNRGQTFSLFIQTLAIASLLGALLYFFFIRLVEEPLRALNSDLDIALREGREDISTRFQFDALKALVANINSALTRVGKNTPGSSPTVSLSEREVEAGNLVQMIGWSAMAISALDQRVIDINPQFESLVRAVSSLKGQPLRALQDSSLRKNIEDMLPQLRNNPQMVVRSELQFEGIPHELTAQAVMGTTEPIYFVIAIRSLGIDGGHS